MVKEAEGWMCLKCVDDHLHEINRFKEASSGGVILPAGVENTKQHSIRELMPNRAARRRMK